MKIITEKQKDTLRYTHNREYLKVFFCNVCMGELKHAVLKLYFFKITNYSIV